MKFNIGHLLEAAAKTAIGVACPAAIPVLNAFLPNGAKVDANTTGEQAQALINQHLTPEQRTQLLSQELDLEKTSIEQVNQTMRVEAASSDPYVSHARPTLLYIAGWSVGFEIVMSVVGGLGAIGYSLYKFGATPAAVTTATQLIGLIAQINQSVEYQVIVLLSACGVYIHRRTRDKEIAAGAPATPGLLGTLAGMFGSKK